MSDDQGAPQKISKTTWFNHIETWQKSGKTQQQYCEENNLSYATFVYWRTDYLKQTAPLAQSKQQNKAVERKSAFIPVKLSDAKSVSTDVIQARFPSGLTLALPQSMSTNDMVKLLQALEQHHAH